MVALSLEERTRGEKPVQVQNPGRAERHACNGDAVTETPVSASCRASEML